MFNYTCLFLKLHYTINFYVVKVNDVNFDIVDCYFKNFKPIFNFQLYYKYDKSNYIKVNDTNCNTINFY